VLFREGSDRPLTVTRSSAIADGPGWRLQFAEIRDRAAAEALRGAYLEIAAGPDAVLPRGAYFWHEVIGSTVAATDGTVLGTVRDVYRSGGAEVYVVEGGPYGEFDVPGVRDFVRIFAPKRGEIVVDVDALDLGPPNRRRAPDDPDRPRGPRRRPGPRRPKAQGSPNPDRAEEAQAADSPEAHSPDAGS
jgi:16S rRNA processing protein RimM